MNLYPNGAPRHSGQQGRPRERVYDIRSVDGGLDTVKPHRRFNVMR